MRRLVIPRSGSSAHAASTASRFIIGSPMPMNTAWSTRPEPAEVERLVEDLPGRQVAAEAHLPGRAERAGERAAGLRGEAQRAPAVPVDASAPPRAGGRRAVWNSALTVPSLAWASSSRVSVENGTRSLELRARSAAADRSSRRSRGRPARPSARSAWRGTSGSPRSVERWLTTVEIHRSLWWQPDAPGQIPRLRRRRLPPRRRGADPRRPGDGRRRDGRPIRRATSGRSTRHGRRRAGRRPSRRARRLRGQQAARRRLDGVAIPSGRPTVVSLVPHRRCACIPVGRLDVDTTGLILLTNDGDLAHRLTHPSFEVRQDLPGSSSSAARSATRALRALRAGVELDDGLTAPARVRRVRRTRSSSRSTRAASARSSGCASASAIRVVRLERVRFGPLTSATSRPGAYRAARAREEVGALRPPPAAGSRAAASLDQRAVVVAASAQRATPRAGVSAHRPVGDEPHDREPLARGGATPRGIRGSA